MADSVFSSPTLSCLDDVRIKSGGWHVDDTGKIVDGHGKLPSEVLEEFPRLLHPTVREALHLTKAELRPGIPGRDELLRVFGLDERSNGQPSPTTGPRGGTTTRTSEGMVRKNLWLSYEENEALRLRAFQDRRAESRIIRSALRRELGLPEESS